jgi:hypothetical protein
MCLWMWRANVHVCRAARAITLGISFNKASRSPSRARPFRIPTLQLISEILRPFHVYYS